MVVPQVMQLPQALVGAGWALAAAARLLRMVVGLPNTTMPSYSTICARQSCIKQQCLPRHEQSGHNGSHDGNIMPYCDVQ